MKKVVSALLMLLMLMSLTCTAFAENVGTAHYFEVDVQCKDSSIYHDAETDGLKTVNNQSIYVRHHVNGGSDEYTNHFRGRKTPTKGDMDERTNCGAKWCTVGLNVPIQSSSIATHGYFYSVAARGNTNHYDYDGVRTIELYGNMYL